MRNLTIGLILAASGIWAQNSDRSAVEKTVDALNTWPLEPGLFTKDFDGDAALRRPAASIAVQCPKVWWETCGTVPIGGSPEAVLLPAAYRNPRILVTKVRFVTPDVAMVDASRAGFPLLIVLKKDETGWKIASLRELADK